MPFVVYRSSAGSGKTYTLVKEYLKIVLSSDKTTKFRNILAITFTNKAANEMKERVINALTSFSQEDVDSKFQHLFNDVVKELESEPKKIQIRAKNVLSEILHNYSDFAIITIDKFVHRVVRAFAHDFKIPLNFDIHLKTDDILDYAVDNLLERAGEDKQLTALLKDFVRFKVDDEKSWSLEDDLGKIAKRSSYK